MNGSSSAPAPAAGDWPGRRDNIVISRPERIGDTAQFVSSLIVDDTHRYFFDHPCDHVPGMLLLEACAQVARAAISEITPAAPEAACICGYEVNFGQFVECGLPTTLTSRVHAGEMVPGGRRSRVEITIAQQGVVSGTTTVDIALAG